MKIYPNLKNVEDDSKLKEQILGREELYSTVKPVVPSCRDSPLDAELVHIGRDLVFFDYGVLVFKGKAKSVKVSDPEKDAEQIMTKAP